MIRASLAAVVLLLGGCSGVSETPVGERSSPATRTPSTPRAEVPRTTVTAETLVPVLPLAGRVVVLDPGHQLGNGRFPSEIGRLVDAGGFTKPCNTTGTSTDAGYPEATLNWEVARLTGRLLRRLGARVVLTRSSNAAGEWGPCVDQRGRAGNPGEPGPTADLKISIHADGSRTPGAHGFHVIAPTDREPWTSDIAAPSLRLAEAIRDALVEEGLPPSTYAGSAGIDVRSDLGTLNLADVPTVLVELGNMRDAGDAALMTSGSGRRGYAAALADAVEHYLTL
ncbi:N-acetylmuramoyl-L-alanine amidase [Nocardioides silvaticus]|uniref:N-acetylmuramoyl-L-alanine amidase n=1 Tax=Nocardioides silvaticus TaxID=2201891 RepID=A0A316TKC6_9ACTN|nr:N-acetylmuramoyl-L-alanine amidase [Nocardioides silvaticus]PWN04880.1 N-acetylmuramoyl-L-alanine amidase [Nocardioides silvaticus]